MIRRVRRIVEGVRALVRGERVDSELDEELRAFLDEAIEEKVRRGMSLEEATRAARLETGLVSVHGVKEGVRDVGWEVWLDTLWQDMRFAARLLARDRGFTFATVAALGLAIGINTSVFAIINAAFLRDLPLDESERLVAIHFRDSRVPQPGPESTAAGLTGASYADLRDWREQAVSFEGLAAHAAPGAMNLSDDGAPAERFRGRYVTANTFRVLRVAPILGRDFDARDDAPGAPGVLMLGYGSWQSRYGGDPSVIGRTVRVNDVPATIIGVMPRGFNYPAVEQVWQAISSWPELARTARDARTLTVAGRLKPGGDLAAARAEMDALTARAADSFAETHRDVATLVRPLRELYSRPPAQMIATMMGAAGFVLLIAYANLANLLLARSIRRVREIAIRLALGSSRFRVVRQFLLECLLIAVAGGAVGFVVSLYGVREIAIAFEPIEAGVPLGSLESNRPFSVDISPNAILYAFVGLVSLASAVAFGLLPAWQMSRTGVNDTLKAESRSGGGSLRGRRWASGLLVSELALALVLLSGAGLLWRDFIEQSRRDTVIDASGVVTMRLSLPPQKYPEPADRKRFLQQLNGRLQEMTAFPAVTMAGHVPLEFGAPAREVFVEGIDYAPGEKPPIISYVLTGARYFETLRLPMVRGRAIQELDARPAQEGAVVDEAFAARFFSNADPVGRRIRIGATGVSFTIVGVARTVPQSGPPPELRPVVYAPLDAEPAPDGRAAIIVRGPLAAASAALREEVRAMDSSLPLFAIETLDQALARGRVPARLFSTWFGSLAFVALVLAAVGVFAITAHGVAQRTEEIGIRMALGADGATVVRLFMRRTVVHLALAIVLGLGGSFALGTLVQPLLQEVGHRDVMTLSVVVIVLGSVTLLATLLPARRAARVDPLAAIRCE